VHCAVVYVCGLDIMLLNLNLFEPLSLYCLPSVGGRVDFNTKKVPIIMVIYLGVFFCVFLTCVYFYVFYLKIQKNTQKNTTTLRKTAKIRVDY
jgi:hypothetical protein